MSNIANLGNFPHTIGNLDDRPNLTAAQMKAKLEQDVMALWAKLAEAIPYINDILPASRLVDIVNSSSTDSGVPTAKAVYDAIANASLGGSAQQIIDDWLDAHPEATTTVTDGSITNAKLATSFVTPGVASAYVSNTAYPAGSYVFKDGVLYTNPEDVSDAVWTAAHWAQVNVCSVLYDTSKGLDANTDYMFKNNSEYNSHETTEFGWLNGTYDTTTGAGSSGNTRLRTTEYIDADKYYAVDVSSDYIYEIIGYDSDKTYLGRWTGSSFKKQNYWLKGLTCLPDGMNYFRIIVSHPSGDEILVDEFINVRFITRIKSNNGGTILTKTGGSFFTSYAAEDAAAKNLTIEFDLESTISKVNVDVCSKNIVDPNNVEQNKDLQGGTVANGDYLVTNYINVIPNHTYYKTSAVQETNAGEVSFYGSTKNYLDKRAFVKDGHFTTPSDCYYLRAEYLITNKTPAEAKLMICDSICADYKYVPYAIKKYTLPFVDVNGTSLSVATGSYNVTDGVFTIGGSEYKLPKADFYAFGDGSYVSLDYGTATIQYIADGEKFARSLVVTPEMFGAVGNGAADDSAAFDAAFDWCVSHNRILSLGNKKYIISSCNSTVIPSIAGEPGSTLIVGSKSFVYNDYFSLRNVTIQRSDAVATTDAAYMFLSAAAGTVCHKVIVNDVDFVVTNADDTHRGGGFMRLLCESADISNVQISGARDGFVFNNVSGLVSDKYTIKHIYGKNMQTLIDVEGYITTSDYSGNLSNFIISDVSLKNTYWQSVSYTNVVGSDCILISFVNNVSISNVYAEYVIERAIYSVCCTDMTIENVTSIHGEGVKIAGYNKLHLTPPVSEVIYSRNVKLSNLFVTNPHEKYALLMYEVDHVDCSNIYLTVDDSYVPGDLLDTAHCVGITGVSHNVTICHVRAVNTARGVIHIYAAGLQDDIDNVKIIDVVSDVPSYKPGQNYYAIRFYGGSNLYAKNIYLEDILCNPGKEKYDASSECPGLLDAAYCKNLVVKNCDCKGINGTGTGYHIADTCQDVTIIGDIETTSEQCLVDFKANNVDVTLVNRGSGSKTEVLEALASFGYPSKYRSSLNLSLTANTPKTIAQAFTNGEIKVFTANAFLHGVVVDSVFTVITKIGDIGVDNESVVLDISNMSLTSSSDCAAHIEYAVW